jgi:hypothetical protein
MPSYLIACEIIRYEVGYLVARIPNPPQVLFLRKGYHQNPADLRAIVQQSIDTAPKGVDRILLGYGLCGKGLEGVQARTIPLILPRMHDCISLLLGSARAYQQHFNSHPGTYYYSPGWVEWGMDAVERTPAQGFGLGKSYDEYVAQYGEENARYLWELEQSWSQKYTRAAYIDAGIPDTGGWEQHAREIADEHGWTYERVAGNLRLAEKLLTGPWDNAEFLTVPPGQTIHATGDDCIMNACQGCV